MAVVSAGWLGGQVGEQGADLVGVGGLQPLEDCQGLEPVRARLLGLAVRARRVTPSSRRLVASQ